LALVTSVSASVAKRLFCVSALTLSATTVSCGGAPTAPSTGGRSIVVNGASRTYTLHVPAAFRRNVGALVIALHGAGDTGLSFERSTGLSAKADQAGFAVIYPDGLFNARLGATDWQHFGDDFADDVSFVRQLIASVTRDIQSDPNRTYIVGFSDGGRPAHRAAVELSDLIAAIGDVEGSLYEGVARVPPTRGPVSVLMLHGDADAYCGSPLDASQDQTFDYWSTGAGDNCSSLTPAAPLCDTQGHITAVVDKIGANCSAGTAVRLYRLIGAQHAWYGTPLNVPGQVPFNPDFDAATGVTTNDVVWNFFAAHPKR
jgi:polyhydroxybutyrate depolymerase